MAAWEQGPLGVETGGREWRGREILKEESGCHVAGAQGRTCPHISKEDLWFSCLGYHVE